MKRWLLPLIAAVTVLALVGGLWWLAGSGTDGDGGATDGSVAGGGSSGEPGGGGSEPGDRGSELPGSPPADQQPPEPEPTMTNPRGVRIDSYYAYDERRLAINYTIGVPACYGTIDRPEVTETRRSVTVTLTRIEPTGKDDVACIEIALLKSVDIVLSEPLGDRVVRDGSFAGAVVPPGAKRDDPRQEK